MKYCFGCDGKFGAKDGIASSRKHLIDVFNEIPRFYPPIYESFERSTSRMESRTLLDFV